MIMICVHLHHLQFSPRALVDCGWEADDVAICALQHDDAHCTLGDLLTDSRRPLVDEINEAFGCVAALSY